VAVLDGGGGVDELVEEVTGAGQAGGHGLGKDFLAVDRGVKSEEGSVTLTTRREALAVWRLEGRRP